VDLHRPHDLIVALHRGTAKAHRYESHMPSMATALLDPGLVQPSEVIIITFA
jgi:hypothetical protein